MSAKIEIQNLLRHEPFFSGESEPRAEPRGSAVKSRVGLALAELTPSFSTTTPRDVPTESDEKDHTGRGDHGSPPE
jgi:hypothetical protein